MKNQSRETTHCNLLTERVGITYPLIQGAMAGISTADFVNEVSKTGILGTLSTYGLSLEECLKEIRQLKKAQRPFACNLMLQQPNVDQLLEIILAEKVKIVSLSAGYRPDFVKRLKAAEVIVLAVVGSPEQAKKMMHVAVDFLIAEGSESGGHIGSYRRDELCKFLAENTTIPYIMAGGIHDDRGFQKALEQGASGVQIGTPLLLTTESPLPEQQKIALLQAKTDAVMVQTKESGLALRGVLVDGKLVPCGVSTGLISDILSLEERVHQIVERQG